MKTYVRAVITTTLASAFVAAAGHAHAQAAYPSKPLRMVIGFAPGGPADIVARLITPPWSEALSQQVIVDNRGGAGGTIGAELVAKAPPDGYTLGLGSSGNLIVAPGLYPKLGYNVARDLAPVSCVAQTAFVLAVNPTVPAKNVGELVKIAKSRKDGLTFGSSGNGSSSHVAAELFRTTAGVNFVHVPYKGTGPSLAGVAGGEIDMMFADMSPALPLAKNGRLRLIANLGAKRSAAAPDLPTVSESGVKMPPFVGRYIVFAPAGTSRDIINRLHGSLMGVLKTRETQQRFDQAGIEIVADTPEHCAGTLRSEGEIYANVIRKAGIKPE